MQEKRIIVKHYPIRLGQFLKLAEAVSDGLEAKQKIAEQHIEVNGTTETRRGRQLRVGDRVLADGISYICS